jgi:hypothetical protein
MLAAAGDFAGDALLGHGEEDFPGFGRTGHADDFDGDGRSGFADFLAQVVRHDAHAAAFAANDEDIAEAKRSLTHQHGGNRAAMRIEVRFDDDAFGLRCGVGLELHQFGLKQDHFKQLVEIGALLGREFDEDVIAAEFLREDAVLHQLGANTLGIGGRQIDLVDGDEDGHAGFACVIDGLDRLRLDAVVGGNDEHHHVRDAGAAGAHRAEGRVARSIQEDDGPAIGADVIRADMLRDPAVLALDDLAAAIRVEQRGLAVVDVAHDRHHRGTQHGLFGIGLRAVGLDVLLVALMLDEKLEAEVLGEKFAQIGVDQLVDGEGLAHEQQALDQFGGGHARLLGEFPERDGRSDMNRSAGLGRLGHEPAPLAFAARRGLGLLADRATEFVGKPVNLARLELAVGGGADGLEAFLLWLDRLGAGPGLAPPRAGL